jgi:predicted transcriptional regulator of viral defense system
VSYSAALEALADTFTYTQAVSAGMNHHRLYKLRDLGEIEQIGRGLFRKAESDLADLDLLEAARRAPMATLCLLSALARHNLTDAIPSNHDIAIPRGTWHPRIGAPIQWHSFDPATFDIGRSMIPIGDAEIGLYDAQRTIIDTYRLRYALGADTAHEALRRWLRGGGQPAQLLATAEAFPRTRPIILRSLEVLL